MLEDLKRYLLLGADLLRARVTTYIRKMQIRHAYAPVKTMVPILLAALSLVLLLSVTVYATVKFAIHSNVGVEAKAHQKNELQKVDVPVNEEPDDYCIAPFPAVGGNDEMKYMIVADKYDRVLHLLKNQKGMWGVIKSYPIAIGANEGRKMTAGDKKTPEGIYFIVGRKEDAEINSIYGPLSYVLNYPNRQDSAEGRSGQGIWIHGTEPGLVPVDTKGCLELHNNNLLKLSKYLKSGMYVPVIIHNNPDFNMQRDINLQQVWAERERVVDAKTTMVASSNIAEGDTVASFKLNDSLPAKTAPKDSVVAVKVVTPAPVATVEKALPKVDSVAKKVLPITKPVTKSAGNADAEIKARIEKWRSNWEQENMAGYQGCYDTTQFKSEGYNWKSWKAKKTRTFKNYQKITVNISDIKITVQNDSTATAIFRQNYQSDQFKADNGKKLALKKSGGKWKIVQEITATYKE